MSQPSGMGSGNMYRYPSQASMHSMASIGFMPPGHGYIPRKQKPDKPYGPDFVSRMNRTWRGAGKRNLYYAIACGWVAILFFVGCGVYWGHRNTSRMIVLRTEVWGMILTVIGILFTGLTFHFIWLARRRSNDWRTNVRFRAEGLFMAASYNNAYVPEDGMKLATGTYGARAVKEIPKPKRGGRSRRGSQSSMSRVAMANAQHQAPEKSETQPPSEPKVYPQDQPQGRSQPQSYSSDQPQTYSQGQSQGYSQTQPRYEKNGQDAGRSHHGSRDYLGQEPVPAYAQVKKSRPPPSPETYQQSYPQSQRHQPPPSPMAREAATEFAPFSTSQPQQSQQAYSMRHISSRPLPTTPRGYAMPIQGIPYNSESDM